MKWLLYLCLILLWFRYLDGLPKTYFRKVEFNCKIQLPTSDLFLCPKCTSCLYVVGFLLYKFYAVWPWCDFVIFYVLWVSYTGFHNRTVNQVTSFFNVLEFSLIDYLEKSDELCIISDFNVIAIIFLYNFICYSQVDFK